jgi:hypothetical protein
MDQKEQHFSTPTGYLRAVPWQLQQVGSRRGHSLAPVLAGGGPVLHGPSRAALVGVIGGVLGGN